VVTTRGKDFLTQFTKEYQYIEVVDLNFKMFFTKVGRRMLRGKTAVFVPSTFGSTPMHIKIMARLMSAMKGSYNFGYKEKGTSSMLLDYAETFDLNLLQIENVMKFFSSLGITVPTYEMRYRYDTSKCKESKAPYVLLHPFGSNIKRSIPLSWMPQIVTIIKSIRANSRIVISGGPADIAKADKIRTILPECSVEFWCGNNPVSSLVCMVEKAEFYIGVDTGITHLAAMLNKKSLVLANASNLSWLPNYNKNATILINRDNCTCTGDKKGWCEKEINGDIYYRCLAEIKMETIEANLRNLLN
jgi:ADP-heptose:LPS heptosyltransferase